MATSGTDSVTVPSGISATISTPLVGSGSLNKVGTGMLILSGTDTYTGITNASGGVLAVTGAIAQSAISYASGGTIQPSSGGTFASSPATWTDNDIGGPSVAGNASFDGTTWTVSGGGTDIGGSSDQFNYDYQYVAGNATTTTTVASQSNTSAGAKAGLMFRDGTDADDAYVYLAATPSDGIVLQSRSSPGSNASTAATVTGISAPISLKLSRIGNDFSAYYSSDGVTWTQVGSALTVAMSSTISVGLATTSQNTSALGAASFTGTATSGDLQITPPIVVAVPFYIGNDPCCACDDSQNPIRYFDGTEDQTVEDLSSDAFGLPWGQSRSWTSRTVFTPATQSGNGIGWIDSNAPYLVSLGDDPNNPSVIAVNADQDHLEFTFSGSAYIAPYGDTSQLVHDTTDDEYVLTDASGNQTVYYDFSSILPPALQGQLKSYTTAAGATINTTYNSSYQLTQELETDSNDSGESGESVEYDYTYLDSSDRNAGLLSSVVEKIARGGASAATVRQVVYSYYQGTYTGSDASGNLGDLKTAIVEDASGDAISTDYYRYYTPIDDVGDPHGSKDLLEYRVNPQEFARMENTFGSGSVYSLTDAQVAPYAQNYYQYTQPSFSDHWEISLETAAGSGSDSTGGLGTYTYDYLRNNNSPDPTDYNQWFYETIETTPSGSTNTDFANSAGNTILKVKQSGSQTTLLAHVLDSQGRIIQSYQPSAVEGYDSSANDLAIEYEPYSGLVNDTTYYTSTNASTGTAGAVTGYVENTAIQYGNEGTPTLTESYTYIANVDSLTGATTYPVATDTVYRNSNGSGAETTSYAYTWFPDTSQIEQTTETLPTISTLENGSNTSSSVLTVVNNVYGQTTWTQDAGGFLTYTAYDPTTGAVIETIKDVNTSNTSDYVTTTLPSGWSTPTGGGLNLVTSYQVDLLGRTTEVTTPNGNMTYTVYDDVNHSVSTYPGWNSATGLTTGPTSVYTENWSLGYTEALTTSATPDSTDGVPNGTESITADNIQSMTRDVMNTGGQEIEQDAYFNLSGVTYSTSTVSLGTVNDNYYATEYGYNTMGRQNLVNSSNGTITKNIFNYLGNLTQTLIGTTLSNLTDVADYTYDADSDLTQATLKPGGTQPNRVTTYTYDNRDRLILEIAGYGSAQPIVTATTYDNLDEVTEVQQYAGATYNVSGGNSSLLRAETTTAYDDQGRPYQASTFSVAPATSTDPGNVSTGMITNYYYDSRGDLMATESPAGLWTKMAYDGADRLVAEYQTDGAAGTSWADASGVSADHVFSQTLYTYDGDNNIIFTTTAQRFGTDAVNTSNTSIGVLGTPTSTGAPPARVSYSASYFDAADRSVAAINAGTFGGVAYTAPTVYNATGGSTTSLVDTSFSSTTNYSGYTIAILTGTGAGERATITNYNNSNQTFSLASALSTAPDSTSTFILVDPISLLTQTTYNAAGWVQDTVDPKGIVAQTSYDLLGRTTQTVADYTNGIPTDSSNQTTDYTYDGDNHVLTMTANMPSGEISQLTHYVYGVTVSSGGSDIDDNDLLAEVQYPDPNSGTNTSTGTYNQSEGYSYDALGEQIGYADRDGTAHTYNYDALGRLLSDSVSAGAGVDNTVAEISYGYNDAGLMQTATSQSSSGTVINQIQDTYDGFGNLLTEAQSVSGLVTSGTRTIDYEYDASHGDRLIGITYPDGRTINYNYSGSNLDSIAGRISNVFNNVSSGLSTIQGYAYLGLNTPVEFTDANNSVGLDYISGTPGDGGDQYSGLDRFGRIVDQSWTGPTTGGVGTGPDVDVFAYGYDQDSNVLYKQNNTNVSGGTFGTQSQVYGYDNLNRLTNFSTGIVIVSDGVGELVGMPATSEGWNLDALGNWKNSSSGSVITNRNNSANNQVTSVGTATLGYDANGNTLTDQNGQVYVYDAWNRLVKVSNANGTVLAQYTYDAEGRRITETQESTTTDLYYSNQDQVIQENVGSMVTAEHVWSPFYVDAMIQTITNPQVTTNQSNGSVDTGFGVTNTSNHTTTTNTSTGITIARAAADGSDIVVATMVGSTPELLFYNSSGGLDTAYGSGTGIVSLGGSFSGWTSITGIVVQSDGDIDLAVQTSSGGMSVAQLNPDGTADTSFGSSGLQTFSGGPAASGIVIADNGDLLVAGATSSSFVVAEFNCSSGAMESSYNSSGATSIAAPSSGYNLEYIGMAVSPDGDLILLGTYTFSIPDVGISSAPALWAVTPQGAADMSFGSSGVHRIVAAYSLFPGYTQVAVNGDGQIFVGTAITTPGSGHTAATVSMKVLEFDADGSADTSFGTSGIATTGTISGDGSGLILQIQLNGQIVVGFGGTGGGGHFVLARFNGSGGLDSTFGSSGIEVGAAEGGGLAMVTASNGETVLIGKVSSGNGIILQEFGTLAKTFTYYVEYDADYNVTSLTDTSGNVLERYEYDPYGNVTVLNANGTTRGDGSAASSFYGSVYLDQDMRLDPLTGLYDNFMRIYDPALGRSLQEDPDRYVNGLNMYPREMNNPINRIDPSGLALMLYGGPSDQPGTGDFSGVPLQPSPPTNPSDFGGGQQQPDIFDPPLPPDPGPISLVPLTPDTPSPNPFPDDPNTIADSNECLAPTSGDSSFDTLALPPDPGSPDYAQYLANQNEDNLLNSTSYLDTLPVVTGVYGFAGIGYNVPFVGGWEFGQGGYISNSGSGHGWEGYGYVNTGCTVTGAGGWKYGGQWGGGPLGGVNVGPIVLEDTIDLASGDHWVGVSGGEGFVYGGGLIFSSP